MEPIVISLKHIVAMHQSWGLLPKILSGEKTVLTRWYKDNEKEYKTKPWDNISKGETIYFHVSGLPVTAKAKVKKIIQLEDITPKSAKEIIEKYYKELGLKNPDEFHRDIDGKKYCILVFIEKPEKIKPFYVDKTGYGILADWMVLEDEDDLEEVHID
ncbi:MAG: hypothetical protein MAG795_00012 [Candidatus Woesearchaeota archaeon]|nr:hypothetical protein [Candidatus Woesearchaeota archaeon]